MKREEAKAKQKSQTLQEAKAALDADQVVELDLPRIGNHLPANYHAYINEQRNYACDVHYGGEDTRRKPFVMSVEWTEFFRKLPQICRESNEWVVL